jgi:hypothetical protein
LNQEKTTGWYCFSSGCANAPFQQGVVMAVKGKNGEVVQVAFNPNMGTGAGEICRRSFTTVWSTWEYYNPPGVLGQEYPTVERYLGKTVYCKVVDFGTLPVKGNKNTRYNNDGATPIAVALLLSDGCMLNAGYGKDRTFSEEYGLNLDITKFNVRVRTEGDFSSLTAHAIVKYIKDGA